jgi:hypothetical protein
MRKQIPGNIEIIEEANVIQIILSSMLPRQNYHVVATNLKSNAKDNFNIEHASALQKNIIDGLLNLKNPRLDAIPLVNKISFNKDTNTWRIEIFSIKISTFGETIPSKVKGAFNDALSLHDMEINWSLKF